MCGFFSIWINKIFKRKKKYQFLIIVVEAAHKSASFGNRLETTLHPQMFSFVSLVTKFPQAIDLVLEL